MGTQYTISELMDNYLDMEFLPERQQGADTYNILRNVRRKVKVKKRIRLGSRILAAIAAAVTVILTVTAISSPDATLTSMLGTEYKFGNNHYSSCSQIETVPYSVEGDRVIFTADSQNIDITDLIKDNNIYFYEYSVTDSHGLEHLCYIGVAGSVDDLGFGEIVFSSNFADCIINCVNSFDNYYIFDGKEIHERDLTEEQYAARMEVRQEDKPWWENFEKRAHELIDEHETIGATNGGSILTSR